MCSRTWTRIREGGSWTLSVARALCFGSWTLRRFGGAQHFILQRALPFQTTAGQTETERTPVPPGDAQMKAAAPGMTTVRLRPGCALAPRMG